MLRPAEAPLEPRGELDMASTLLMCEWGYRSSLVLLGFCYLTSLRSQRFSRGPASVGRVQSIPVDLMIPISKFIPLLSIMYICMQSFSQDVKIAYNDGDHNSLSSDPDTSTVLFSSYAIYLNTRKQVICPILQMRNRALRVHNFSIKCQNLEPGTQVYTPVMAATMEAEAGGLEVLEQYRQLSEMRVKRNTTRASTSDFLLPVSSHLQ